MRALGTWVPGKSKGVLVYDPADGRLVERSHLVNLSEVPGGTGSQASSSWTSRRRSA